MKPDRATLERLYVDERRSSRSIAAEFGVSKFTLLGWLREDGIAVRAKGRGLANRGITAPTADELYHMLHVEGLGYREVAERFGVDHTAVSFWIERHDIPAPPTHDARMAARTLPSEAELRALYEGGQSLVAIGARYGMSYHPIAKLCRRYGIEVRRDGWEGGLRFPCEDGHQVRSSYEQRVDNWLAQQRIAHVYEPSLPFAPTFRADFLANGWYIEVWGVKDSPEYNARRDRKRALYHAHHAPLIELSAHMFVQHRNDLWSRRLSQCLTTVPEQSTQLRADLFDE